MADKGRFLPLARARDAAAIEAAETDQAERKRSPTHKRGQGPLHERFIFRLDDVDSLSTFMDHFLSFPESCFQEYGAFGETHRKLSPKTQSSFAGKGLSFLVSVTSGRQLGEPFINKWPEKKLRRHETIATKIPRIEPKKSNAFNLAGLKAYSLRAVAWETHCLLHPLIRRSKYVVDLLGLSWEPAPTEREQWLVVPALVMEYADEGTLDDLLQCGEGVVSFELKFKLALDVALGLETLHRHGLVHSDLKANNVLLFRSQSETLVAKISDFGCAVHDFGPSETVQLPPYWPRWDAPEARPPIKPFMVEKVPKVDVKVEEVPKVDVYCFGLLFWQMMLDGKTPFDRGREVAAECNIPCFEPIIYATSEEEKKNAIADFKDRPDDEFLRAVRVTVYNRGLDQQVVHDILSQTIRRNPDNRSQMTQLIDDCFERSFAFVPFPIS
jgi:serine/threonine protein kinase